MKSKEIDMSIEPIRLFNSDWLEFFTHVSPITVLVIWLPVIVFFLYLSFVNFSGFNWYIPVGLITGLFLWTFAEYMLHRFVFHFPAKPGWQERISYLFHGIHHHQPKVKTRLVMPPAVSIPLALVFYGFFYLFFNIVLPVAFLTYPIFAGFILGYVVYDMIHYSTHHIPMKKGYLRVLRQQHMHHHFQTPNQRFGVTSPLWDYVFNTIPKKS